MTNLYEIKKSKFYSYIFEVNSKDEIQNIIDNLWKENKKARHICYAYKFKDENNITQVGMQDDGEPKGTAGKPLLSLLEYNEQINKLIVVIRFFGGIKLGAGPLARAYISAGKMIFNNKK